MPVARHWAVALVALAAAASGAAAQAKKGAAAAPAPTCAISTDDPSEVKDAASQVATAQFQNKLDAKKKALAKAVEKLSLRPDHYKANMAGYEYTMGQALVLWAAIPGQPAIVKRGDIGFLGDKDQNIDLLLVADSMFTLVEKAMPDCVDQITPFRQIPWPPLINAVAPLFNANKLDSAQAVLNRSMIIYRNSAFPYYFQTLISGRERDYVRASQSAEKATQLAAAEAVKDTSMAEIAEQTSFLAGYYGQRAADTITGPDKADAMKRVGTLYEAYLKNYPCGGNAESAERGLFQAYRITDDSAGMRAQLQLISAQAKPCSDLWWYTAGTLAVEANDLPLAVTLADKAVAYSPWSPGLGAAGQIFWKAEEWAKMLPVAKRVAEMKPNSSEDYQSVAIAYQGLAKAATTPAVKQAYGDSLVTAYNAGERLTVLVRISEFTWNGQSHTLAGTIQLADTAAASAAASAAAAPSAAAKPKGKKGAKPAPPPPPPPEAKATPKPAPRAVTISVQFLDHGGTTVASDSASVQANVDDKAPFKIVVRGPKIIGYRYAPIH